jgi:phosphoribosylformylglycinamidine synthase
LGQSLYLREIIGQEIGSPPPVDLEAEKRNGDFVREQITGGTVGACNDVSDGGVLVCVAEMAIKGGIGATLQVPESVQGHTIPAHAWLFGEDQGRYVLTTEDAEGLLAAAEKAGVPAMQIGISGGQGLSLLGGTKETALKALRQANEDWLPAYMGGA